MKFNDAYSQMFPGYPDAVSLQQAAEMLGLNRHTVGELIRSRRLFALKIGRTYRIPKLSVIEFLLTGQSAFPAGNPPLDDSPLLGKSRTNMGDLNLLTQTGLKPSAMGELELLPVLFTLSPDRRFAAKDITAGDTLSDLKLLIQKERL